MRLQRDLAALQARPAAPYEACEREAARVSAMSLVRFDRNDYSVLTTVVHGSEVRAQYGVLAPRPLPRSRDADVLRASELEHAVQHVGGDRHLGRPAPVRVRA